MKSSYGLWLGWLAIILAVVGFFYEPYWFAGGAIVLGLISLTSPQKLLAWGGVGLGVVVVLITMFL